jgi:hypothetical protein
MTQSLTTLLLATILAVGSFIGGIYYHKQGDTQSLKELAYYQKTYLRKQGATVFVKGAEKGYNLHSFDGGKIWYAVTEVDDGSLKVLGSADVIYPGLIQHLHGLDMLVDYVQKNGPVTFSGGRAATDQKLMEAAGFTVTHK